MITAVLYPLAPFQVVQVPLHGLAQAGFEGFFGGPPQLTLDLAGVDGIALVMARAVVNESNQLGIVGHSRRTLWRELFEQRADSTNNIDVFLLVVATNVVGLADLAFADHFEQCTGMVLDEQPVPYLQAIAVNRQRLTSEGVEDHQRNQFFREMERPVIVRAVGDQCRQTISALPGADQVVGCRLAGGIGRAWRVGRGFAEQVVDAMQVAIHFVGGNVMQAKRCTFLRGQRQPVGASRFQQAVGTDDIGLN
ncbi:hypothetical protein D3C77_419610 [compost metagenome]